jgi:hypothetical protein
VTILPIKLTNDDRVIQLSRIAVVDLEASGLGSASYPTEIGWAIIQDDGATPNMRWFCRSRSSRCCSVVR